MLLSSAFVFASVHEKAKTTDKHSRSNECGGEISEACISDLKAGCHTTAEEDDGRVEPSKDDLKGQLKQANVQTESREVKRLLFEESCVAKEMLLELGA